MHFIPGCSTAPQDAGPCFWLVFYKDQLLVEPVDGAVKLPFSGDPFISKNLELLRKIYLGRLDGFPCYAAEVAGDRLASEDAVFLGLRRLFFIDVNLFRLAGRAVQLIDWDRTHQYCGRCGTRTYLKTDEMVKACPDCSLFAYPRISPAVIAAVIKDNQILLAHGRLFSSKFYSVLSGFVEPGETLEECLHREVKEEVGIEIKNIRYFGSQSWPFPHSLMIAFTADYDRGEITVNPEEIVEARWFTAANLPAEIPSSISIARRLIDWFKSR